MTSILFFPGIFIKNLNISVPEEDEEETVNAQYIISAAFDDEISDPIEYTPMPTYFIPGQWIQATNLLCWFCHSSFKTVPIPLSLGRIKLYDSGSMIKPSLDIHINSGIKELDGYISHGVFCSEICASSYLHYVKDPKIVNQRESRELLPEIIKHITGKQVKFLPIKPLWHCMKKYSGSAGITEMQYSQY